MKAYARKYNLNPEQAALARAELSSFIAVLMSGIRREPTMLPEKKITPAFHDMERDPVDGRLA